MLSAPVLKLSTPPLRMIGPAKFTVPPSMLIVPVAFTVVVPVPLWKVPPLWTFSVPVLKKSAPMTVPPAPLTTKEEPAPVIVIVPVLATLAGAMVRLVAFTTAPLWMFSVPLVPTTNPASMDTSPRFPVLTLLKVRIPVPPLSPKLSPAALKSEPTPSTVTVPFPPVPIEAEPRLERLPPRETPATLPPLNARVELIENVEPAPLTRIVEAELLLNDPVMSTSPPFCTVSVLPAATVNPSPVAVARVICAPARMTLSLKTKLAVPDTLIELPLLKVCVLPAVSVVTPAFKLKSAPMELAVAAKLNAPAPALVIAPLPAIELPMVMAFPPLSVRVVVAVVTAPFKTSAPLVALIVEVAASPKLTGLLKVCVLVSLLVSPPALMLSVPVPPITNAPAVLLKVTLFA